VILCQRERCAKARAEAAANGREDVIMSQLIVTTWRWCFGGSDGYSVSAYLSFSPINGAAQTTLATCFADGYAGVGFPVYTYRPTPNGGDIPVVHGFNEYFDYPPNIWNSTLSSVTAELDLGGDLQTASFVVNVFAF
jgi:hypothetical protein